MPEKIENKMVVDSQWADIEHNRTEEVEKVLSAKGYHELGTNVFVAEEDAFRYALERCLNGTEEEQKEFKEMLVEWFYSGNWVKEE